MNGRILLDTNIIVYIYDSFEAVKQERAITIVDKLIKRNRAVISTQIMGEFFIATTRTKRQLLEISEASDRIRNYIRACHVVDVTQLIILEAIRG